jgi:hypothetical protein
MSISAHLTSGESYYVGVRGVRDETNFGDFAEIVQDLVLISH